jgi:arylsulfatase A-like enzyme|tara:strand:+ start:69 stop:1751 length:1683 start_codon:yes stop_codon:yes gene_type:complete
VIKYRDKKMMNKQFKIATKILGKMINVFLVLIVLSCQNTFAQIVEEPTKPNVLFIIVDDLKPILGCYGDPFVKTPNIDRFAKEGVVFTNTYCQQAVCGPSRASFLTGMRPDYTGVWDLETEMRNINPEILSMPQFFKQNGYITAGIGKVFDSRSVDENIDKPSWSIPFYKKSNDYYPKEMGKAKGRYRGVKVLEEIEIYEKIGGAKGLTGKELSNFIKINAKPSVESLDIPDNAYIDGATVLHSKDILKVLKENAKPFFFAVGITKPHLPFAVPKKYWDLYNRDEIQLAEFRENANNSPLVAYHGAGELYKYADIPPIASFSDVKGGMELPFDKQKELIHGYYASVSYADALIGKLISTLVSLNLKDNTIVTIIGDHGWHLGDHNLWCKHSNFEQATRIPMIFKIPGIKASKTSALAEAVDIFPTLCDATGIKIPEQLQGVSLMPILKEIKSKVKDYAVSQYRRGKNMRTFGYSIRTERFRLTLWMKDFYRLYKPFDEGYIVSGELYDYDNDPLETENYYNNKEYVSVKKELLDYFAEYAKQQNEELKTSKANRVYTKNL